MENKRQGVNRNIRIRMSQMRKTIRRTQQMQHQQQLSLHESFMKIEQLHDRYRKMWGIGER